MQREIWSREKEVQTDEKRRRFSKIIHGELKREKKAQFRAAALSDVPGYVPKIRQPNYFREST